MSRVLIYHHKNDRERYNHYINEIRKIGGKKLCFSKIGNDFLNETLDACDYLFVHVFRSEIRGFACVDYNTQPKHIYIDLICNTKFHAMKSRSTKHLVRLGGKDIINAIHGLGERLKARYVKLNAIQDVISYYHHFGYTFENPDLRYNSKNKLVEELQKAQGEKNQAQIDKIIRKIVVRYYPKFYNEVNQTKYKKEDSDTKREAMSYGIPMIYKYKKEASKSICKGRSIKNPNKCDKYRIGCSIARGTKRSYCRRSKNKTRKINSHK
jgi:hypothetical protein